MPGMIDDSHPEWLYMVMAHILVLFSSSMLGSMAKDMTQPAQQGQQVGAAALQTYTRSPSS